MASRRVAPVSVLWVNNDGFLSGFRRNLKKSAHDGDRFFHLMRRLVMQTSARNQFAGKVVSLKTGPINAELTVDLGGSDRITAMITRESVASLGLKEGVEVYALVKASSIIIAPGSENLRLSARNQLRGVVVSCRKGAVNAEVSIQLQGDKLVTAVITNESIDRLGLKEGDQACAIFKASSVIIGV